MLPDRVLLHPRLPWIAAVLAMLLALPSLGGGLVVDDWYHRARMMPELGILPGDRGPLLEMFAFFPSDPAELKRMVETGLYPWWTNPEIHGAFLRPVSALTHVIDFLLWKDVIWLQHLHSLCWLGASVLAAGAFLRQWLGPGRAASLALLFFAVDDAHAWPAAWLANRNALVAMTFGALALTAFLQKGWRRQGLAMVLLGCALLSAEAGFATVGVIAALVLFAPGPLLGKRLIAPACVATAWALLWRGLGFGVHGSGLYIDPTSDPQSFLLHLPSRLVALMAAQWLNAPVDGWVLLPERWEGGLALGLAALLGWGMVRFAGPTLRVDPRARQALAGAVFAALPTCAGFPMERLVTIGGFCGAALLGLLVERGARALAWWHGPVAALLFLLKVTLIPTMMGGSTDGILRILADPELEQHHVVVVSGVELSTAYIPILGRMKFHRTPAGLALLLPAATAAIVTRTDENTLQMVLPQGGFRHPVERLCRSGPFVAGTVIPLPDVTITVTSVDDEGFPTVISARFVAPLEDPRWRWYEPDGLDVRPWQPPSIGQSVTVLPILPLSSTTE